MIKFFRKIRKNLLSEGQTGKYFKYAIGEIILVVIGILIALQLNTWKENNKNTKIEISYLKGIRNNLDADIYELNKQIGKDTMQYQHYSTILKAFTDKSINKYSREFIKALGKSYIVYGFNGNSIVFEDMKSSGKINYIKSDVLRFSILEYYNDSQREVNRQNKMHIPEMNKLRNEAFHDNLDMNSLVEKFLVQKKWRAEIDQLDLSFFDSDVKSEEVKRFANRISIMKALVQVNDDANFTLLLKAQRLKNKITEYVSTDTLDGKNYIPIETLSAIKEGDINKLKKIIPNESLNNCMETEYDTSNYMVIAIYEDSLESLKYFVENGADIEHVCENKTPLMYAVKKGSSEMTKYLIEVGADINVVSIKDKTALDYAIQYKRPKLIKYLKELNAKQVMTLSND